MIIPAYNESQRLPPYLDAIRRYLSRQFDGRYEVIVVDDGSSDHLLEVISEIAAGWPQLRTISHVCNQGKGAAVRTGILDARGDRLLFADADGATPIEEEGRLRAALDAGADLAVGSRLLDADSVVRNRTRIRALIGRAFAAFARRVLPVPVVDTQCGFKMMKAAPGRRLFSLTHENGYLFDLEILSLAQRSGYRIVEVPINWSDKPGSRLNMGRESWKILAGLWRIRRRLATMETSEP